MANQFGSFAGSFANTFVQMMQADQENKRRNALAKQQAKLFELQVAGAERKLTATDTLGDILAGSFVGEAETVGTAVPGQDAQLGTLSEAQTVGELVPAQDGRSAVPDIRTGGVRARSAVPDINVGGQEVGLLDLLTGNNNLPPGTEATGQRAAFESGLFSGGDFLKLDQQKKTNEMLNRIWGIDGDGDGAGVGDVDRLESFTIGPGGIIPKFGRDPLEEFMDAPLPTAQLGSYRNAAGEIPPAGITPRQMDELGFRRIDPTQESVNQIIDEIQPMVDNIFTAGEGFTERAFAAAENFWDKLTQNNPNVALYQGWVDGTVAPLIRSLGEKGNLATEDVKRALELFPKLSQSALNPLPDTQVVAQRKLDMLRQVLGAAQGKGADAAKKILNEAQSQGFFDETRKFDLGEGTPVYVEQAGSFFLAKTGEEVFFDENGKVR